MTLFRDKDFTVYPCPSWSQALHLGWMKVGLIHSSKSLWGFRTSAWIDIYLVHTAHIKMWQSTVRGGTNRHKVQWGLFSANLLTNMHESEASDAILTDRACCSSFYMFPLELWSTCEHDIFNSYWALLKDFTHTKLFCWCQSPRWCQILPIE